MDSKRFNGAFPSPNQSMEMMFETWEFGQRFRLRAFHKYYYISEFLVFISVSFQP
jgi:hypothetical protein